MTEQRYEVVGTPPAQRAIAHRLPEPVAAAVIEFITGPLLEDPQRLGHPLRDDLIGIHSARRGTFRVLSRIDDIERAVIVLRVEHRGDVYRHR